MIRRHEKSNIMLLVVIGIAILISLIAVKPITSSVSIGNIGLPKETVNLLRNLLP